MTSGSVTPVAPSTTYYVRYNPGISTGSCSPTTCQSAVVTVNPSHGSQTFSYTGGQQTFTVPSSCVTSITITAIGPQGGFSGGYGGKVQSQLSVGPVHHYISMSAAAAAMDVTVAIMATTGVAVLELTATTRRWWALRMFGREALHLVTVL